VAGAAAAALLLAAAAAVVLMAGGRAPAELEEQARVDAALSQLLAARRAAPAARFGGGKEEAKARMALRELQRSLEGELKSVETLRAELPRGSKTASLHERAAAPAAAKDQSATVPAAKDEAETAAWEKRTMQRGAMRGESTEKQLTRVLEKDLGDKIHKKLHWSKSDLDSAAGFAEYLQAHPLPKLDEPKGEFASLQDTANDSITSEKEDNGVVKVTFKRQVTMTEKEYEEMEKELKDAENAESSSANDDKTRSVMRPSLTVSDKDTSDKDARSDSQVEADRVLSWKPEPYTNNRREAREEERRKPETWTASQKSEGQEVKRLLEKILGVGHGRVGARGHEGGEGPSAHSSQVKYVAQPGDEALALSRKRGKHWAEDEILREKGNFVKLPSRHAMLPLSVQPYYWATLPPRDVRAIEERHQ